MQITVQKSDLVSVLKRCSAAIVVGDALFYKSSVLVVAEGSGITMRSTDNTLSVLCDLKGGAKKTGRALLPHRRLTAIANELPDGEVEISVSDKLQVSIRGVGSKRKFTMQAHEADAFPKVAQLSEGEHLFSMESKVFQQASSDAMISVDEGYIFGALISPVTPLSELKFKMVSIDNRSLVVSTGELLSARVATEVLVPAKLMSAARALPSDKTEVTVALGDGKITLVTAGTTISCDRLAHTFPSVWQMILDAAPKERRFRVAADAFLDSVKAVSVAAEATEGESRMIQIDIAYKDGACGVSTRESETNRGEDELSVQEPSVGQCLIHVNGGLLAQGLRAFGPEHVDVYYGMVEGGQVALFLKSDTLIVSITPVLNVKA